MRAVDDQPVRRPVQRRPCTAPRHGTADAYHNHGCRCYRAALEYSLQTAQARARRREGGPSRPHHINAIGTARRIQALRAIGHPTSRLAAALGVTRQRVTQLSNLTARNVVDKATAKQVVTLYDLWAMTPATDRRARDQAARRGFAPPLAWDDAEIDDPAARPRLGKIEKHRTPDRVAADRCLAGLLPAGDLHPADREACVRILHAQRLNDEQIADRLHCNPRTVLRVRQATGLPTVCPRNRPQREAG